MAGYESPHSDRMSAGLARVGGSPRLTIGAGALTIVIGVLVLVWPGATTVVIAWLLAIQLVVTGVLQLIAAFAGDAGTAERMLHGLLGALSILVGLLCLRAPLQTTVVLGLLIGATWVVGGVIGIFTAISAGPSLGRGWKIAWGLVAALGGAIVLIYPWASLVALTWLFGVVLILTGFLLVGRGLIARRSARAMPASAHKAGRPGRRTR
jgi:uncharacterized membrane protein HdeD (DUF308 family)